MPPFAPLHRRDGYLRLEDYGLIGDGTTAALVGRDGAIAWLCLPRFDSPPLFCSILDADRGGAFTVAPEGLVESRQVYEPDSGVLVTEMRSKTGLVRLTDAMTLRSGADLTEDTPAGRGELLRSIRVLDGRVRLRIEVAPRNGVRVESAAGGMSLCCDDRPDLHLRLSASVKLEGTCSRHQLQAGDRVHLILHWGGGSHRHQALSPEDLCRTTLASWQRWMERFQYDGPQEALVRRSAITLKLLDHFENGAIVAAPTSSLPEAIGGPRNWDYRYAWIRDAAFSVYGLRRIGLTEEAWRFLAWVLDAVERGGRPRVLYNLEGNQPPLEHIDPTLEGYRHSPPVRWGNAAADQCQHDVYGEILDCAYQWANPGGRIDSELWASLTKLIEGALLCSFWLVENLTRQGRLDEAMHLYDSLCARANSLGLLPEQIDPGSGEFLGNYPQAFSHVGLISSGVNLARALRRVGA